MDRRQLLRNIGIASLATVCVGAGGWMAYPLLFPKIQKELMISGSLSVSRFIALLIGPFIEKFPNARVAIQGGGSYAGLVALQNGGIDVAMMSRDLNFDEFNLELRSHLIGIEGVAIVVHPELGVQNITLEKLSEIFEGNITNWSELGGPNKRIHLYGRAEGSTTRGFVEDVVMRGAAFDRKLTVCDSAVHLANAVLGDPHGIGYLTMRNLTDQLKAVAINGIEISDKTLLLKMYPLARDMFLVSKNTANDVAKDFVRYSLSAPAQDIFVKHGLTQVSK
ncbi:phosphate ABC transporter substrate-binding protein [Polynucleobacter sp. UK-Kesae-W10]|uniref:phosphate ABC transporter substrate-binding protein n=1 Tax=Polynucleobacter sp. UK-Kesae-W10 TaxID=1819738 RepID=UPI001C0B55A6|nr:phosphate ABC transporter substrate-binding protein [Polynucleobacter sp. UK-Kesae-W10]MBU3577861.1 phosphate ABC transporter substrate-binding protein [Polynucleobacter sp. UK-Kesae-W10]